MGSENMKNSEVAERAIEIIEEFGWTQRTFGNKEVGFCLLGAGFAAIKFPWGTGTKAITYSDAEQALASRAVNPEVLTHGSVLYLNDAVLNTKEEAIQHLTESAKYWRDRGE